MKKHIIAAMIALSAGAASMNASAEPVSVAFAGEIQPGTCTAVVTPTVTIPAITANQVVDTIGAPSGVAQDLTIALSGCVSVPQATVSFSGNTTVVGAGDVLNPIGGGNMAFGFFEADGTTQANIIDGAVMDTTSGAATQAYKIAYVKTDDLDPTVGAMTAALTVDITYP